MNNQTLPTPALLYISGAGLNSTIWDQVRSKLSLPSAVLTHSHDATTTLDGAVQEALDQSHVLGATRYVIVAHSLGGVIGCELARKLGDQLAGFIAVSATIPAPGESFIDTLPFPQKLLMPALLKLAGTKPPVSAIRKGLCSDLSEEQATELINSFAPEPRSLYIDKTSGSNLPLTKYLYVQTLNDRQLPFAQQSAQLRQLPDAAIADIASGHLPMVSHPDELAAVIKHFIAQL